MELLPTIWFIIIAVLWTGYLFLEGFDLGVGMLMKLFARNNTERRVLLNTVGPVWDGNEVWLVTAGAATFAAFPLWYASLFSALYLPLLVVLVALIFRAVAFEYRGKGDTDAWRARWDWAIALGSFFAAFGVGAALALTTTGLPLNANGDRVGGAFAWFSGFAVLGGLAVVGFSLLHALAFLALKTDGDVRHRARRWFVRLLPVLLLPLAGWALIIQFLAGKPWTWAAVIVAVLAAVAAWILARRGSEGRAFMAMGAFLVLGSASIFGAAFPVVLPSTLDPAFDLTIA
ncbi:MAG TPA: cytochrome d ubiquinol oxidase subunit II, partial [Arthrobacter sp.]